MIFGYINENICLPQITTEMISNVDFLKNFSLVSTNVTPKIFVRSANNPTKLLHLEEDKEVLDTIEQINASQSLDCVENELFVSVKSGDIVITSTLMNFSRYLEQALKVVRFFFEKSVRVISILEKFDSFVLEPFMKSNIYIDFQNNRALETRNMRKKVSEQKKKENSKLGKKAFKVEDFPLFASYYGQWKGHSINKAEFAAKLSVSKPTLDKLIKEFVSKGYDK